MAARRPASPEPQNQNPSSSSKGWRIRTPVPRTALLIFIAAALASALFSSVSDCDETFNYWEPVHYLMYGTGFQTWEYSPVYALRSYLYVGIHAAVGKFFDIPVRLLGLNQLVVFYGIRIFLGLVCAVCQTIFYTGVRIRFGEDVSFYTGLFMLFSAGTWISSTAFLPSSFAMYCVMAAFGLWFSGSYVAPLLIGTCAVLLGWPFAALVFVPLGIDALRSIGVVRVALAGIAGVAVFGGASMLVDAYYYGRWVLAALNIVLYNVLNPNSGGSELYGTEPWSFYFLNGLLNFNVVLPLALAALPVLLLFRKWSRASSQIPMSQVVLFLLPMYLWLAVMSRQPHKEERFLFPIYPLICFAAAAALVVLMDVVMFVNYFSRVRFNRLSARAFARGISVVVCTVFLALAVSRIGALQTNYHAPIPLYSYLSTEVLHSGANPPQGHVNICVGKEWYRFPSSFFLPSPRFHLAFIESAFKGQLPQPFGNSTRSIPANMNDRNAEEKSRYVPLSECHYVVEMEVDEREAASFRNSSRWTLLRSEPFLEASRSPSLWRALWLPVVSARRNTYVPYCLYKQDRMFNSSQSNKTR